MSIALVVTRGYGNGTLIGTIPFVVTRGYSISAEVVIWTVQPNDETSYNIQADDTTTWVEQTDDSSPWTEQ